MTYEYLKFYCLINLLILPAFSYTSHASEEIHPAAAAAGAGATAMAAVSHLDPEAPYFVPSYSYDVAAAGGVTTSESAHLEVPRRGPHTTYATAAQGVRMPQTGSAFHSVAPSHTLTIHSALVSRAGREMGITVASSGSTLSPFVSLYGTHHTTHTAAAGGREPISSLTHAEMAKDCLDRAYASTNLEIQKGLFLKALTYRHSCNVIISIYMNLHFNALKRGDIKDQALCIYWASPYIRSENFKERDFIDYFTREKRKFEYYHGSVERYGHLSF